MRYQTTAANTPARRFFLSAFACLISVLASAASAQDAGPRDQIITDFDKVDTGVSPGTGMSLAEVKGEDGDNFLRVTAVGGGPAKGTAAFVLPAGVKPGESAGFSVQVRAKGAGVPASIRWLALDESGRVILQRRYEVPPGDKFRDVSLPWTQWRWGDSAGGGPGEIRGVGFRVEEPADELHLDDLRLIGGGGAAAADGAASPKAWLRRTAFADRASRTAEADGLLVATDAPDALTDADLARILDRMRRARAMVRRLFGDAVWPVEGTTPPSLLVFRQHNDFVRFFEAVGREWNVRVVPPLGSGMTLQNVAASTIDPKQGAERPVYLHESVHAVLANDVRLLSGNDHHSWLHEGLASYVQLCVYPKSIDRKQLASNFSDPIKPDGSGFFKPLDGLLRKRVNARQYAQVATLVAYLVQEKPQWLPVIAKELRDGRTTEQALRKCGTTVADLQAAWLKWGEAKTKRADAGAILQLPPEFAEAGAK
jgi:hypothetical protein